MYVVSNAMLDTGAPLVTVQAGWDAFTQFAHCVHNGTAVTVYCIDTKAAIRVSPRLRNTVLLQRRRIKGSVIAYITQKFTGDQFTPVVYGLTSKKQ